MKSRLMWLFTVGKRIRGEDLVEGRTYVYDDPLQDLFHDYGYFVSDKIFNASLALNNPTNAVMSRVLVGGNIIKATNGWYVSKVTVLKSIDAGKKIEEILIHTLIVRYLLLNVKSKAIWNFVEASWAYLEDRISDKKFKDACDKAQVASAKLPSFQFPNWKKIATEFLENELMEEFSKKQREAL